MMVQAYDPSSQETQMREGCVLKATLNYLIRH